MTKRTYTNTIEARSHSRRPNKTKERSHLLKLLEQGFTISEACVIVHLTPGNISQHKTHSLAFARQLYQAQETGKLVRAQTPDIFQSIRTSLLDQIIDKKFHNAKFVDKRVSTPTHTA